MLKQLDILRNGYRSRLSKEFGRYDVACNNLYINMFMYILRTKSCITGISSRIQWTFTPEFRTRNSVEFRGSMN
jgi:hypothetical protein